MEFFTKVSKQIRDFFTSLSASRKIALAAIGIGIFVVTAGMFIWASQKAYQPLTYGALSADDASNVMRLLREKKVPFQVDPTGKQITVPPEYLHDLRLELAMQGMPQSSSAGYELFDKQSFGTTTFLNKVNQKRALEGELMRSINAIKGVKRSRIHLATPDKSAFVEDQKKATASVVLDLEPGTNLNDKQIYGIGNLVASAVEGLDAQSVVIVDSFGKTLSKNTKDSMVAMSAEQADFKHKYESELENRVSEKLSRVVGEGHVVTRITADLDFSNIQESQTILDQDGATLKSSQKTSEGMENTRPTAAGVAGAASNTPGEKPAGEAATAKNSANKTNEIVNFDIPKTVRVTHKPSGTVKKLSVAVVVDGKTVKTTDAEGKTTSKNEAWSAENLKKFEEIITGALALDKTRGDTLEIKNMEFVKEDFEEAQKILDAATMRSYIQNLIVYCIIGLVIALFFMFVVRPYIKWITENTTDSVDTFLPQTLEELERIQKTNTMVEIEEAIPDLPDRLDPEKVEGEMIREKIVTLIDNNPAKASLVLKEWLGQGKYGTNPNDTIAGKEADSA